MSTLDRNFSESERAFTRPTLAESSEDYERDAGLRARIESMLQADATQQLYAAILISKVDWTKSQSALQRLIGDDRPVKIQAPLGHSIVETTVGVLARDFGAEGQTRGENFGREANLNRWALAISMEKRDQKQPFEPATLPKWKEVLDARDDADKMRQLRAKIDRLTGGSGGAEKFYAVCLLTAFDEGASKQVLESLLDNNTPVGLLQGDIMIGRPACEVAHDLLYPRENLPPTPPSNRIARATKWLQKNLFRTAD